MTPATGVAEREAAVDMIPNIPDKKGRNGPTMAILPSDCHKTDYQRAQQSNLSI
jgi:hypothetical protein